MVCLIGICLSIFFSLELLRQMPNQFVTLLIALQIAWRTDAIFCSIEIRKFGKKKSIDQQIRPVRKATSSTGIYSTSLWSQVLTCCNKRRSRKRHTSIVDSDRGTSRSRKRHTSIVDWSINAPDLKAMTNRSNQFKRLPVPLAPVWHRFEVRFIHLFIATRRSHNASKAIGHDRVTSGRFFFSLELLRQMPNQFVTLLIALQ